MSGASRLKREKAAMRSRIREVRDALSEEDRAAGGRAIASAVLALPEVVAARTVMVFWSFASEVDTRPIVADLLERGCTVALPRLEHGDIVPVRHEAGDPMAPSAFGMLEPKGGSVVPPDELDVVIAPGLVFDRHGYRLGYGGGYYDRLFGRTTPDAAKVGIAFALQVLDEVPHGRRDVPVDVIVTEAGVIRCR